MESNCEKGKMQRSLVEYKLRKAVRRARLAREFDKSKAELFKRQCAGARSPRCFIIGTAVNGNLGDQAITYAQMRFVRDQTDLPIIEVTIADFWKLWREMRSLVLDEDIICIQGGGSIGNEYFTGEQSRRDVIRTFPHNLIVSFPQTAFFSSDVIGQYEKRMTAKIYRRHQNLHVFAREEKSKELLQEMLPETHVALVPDIVLSYSDYDIDQAAHEGALLCLRSDCEGLLSRRGKEFIESECKRHFSMVSYTDTVEHDPALINLSDRRGMVERKLQEFANAELIITDRLHGMVFAALAGTPCIVLNNYNYKVSGVYKWVKDYANVQLANDISSIKDLIERALVVGRRSFNPEVLKEQFSPLVDVFNGLGASA